MADADDADGDDSMSPVMKRIAVLGLMALTLGACDYGLLLTPDPADPRDTITVTNAPDGPTCFEPLVDPKSAQSAIEQSVPVGIFVMTSILDIVGPTPDVTVVQTDDEGFFTAAVPAPDIPGQHIVVAVCDYTDGPIEEVLQDAAAAAEPVDDDGVIVDELIVTQEPLSIALSDTSVEEGDEVIATFNTCKDENDFDFGALDTVSAAAIPTPEELANDFPDLVVTLDGQPVATIAGTERYPTSTVDVPVTLTEVGDHEIKGVCTFQTFRFGLEDLVELFNESGEELPLLQGVSAAAEDDIAYPFPEEGSEEALFGQWDEATTEAAGTVTVLAVDDAAVPAPAEPAQVQPSFAG
jgi:hypothetical protein